MGRKLAGGFLLRHSRHKGKQTDRTGGNKSHKVSRYHQVNIRQSLGRSTSVTWLFDYEISRKSAVEKTGPGVWGSNGHKNVGRSGGNRP
jgi:hypothetical protein